VDSRSWRIEISIFQTTEKSGQFGEKESRCGPGLSQKFCQGPRGAHLAKNTVPAPGALMPGTALKKSSGGKEDGQGGLGHGKVNGFSN
jgi:hypothetical protein